MNIVMLKKPHKSACVPQLNVVSSSQWVNNTHTHIYPLSPHSHRTPLHCAVAYSNLDMIRYLIGHGASLFLETTEGETPVKIGMEEYRLQQESQGGKTNEATVECLKYLTGEWS